MEIIVHKYGGSSLATDSKLHNIAERIVKLKHHRPHVGIVIVVSARGGTTDDLYRQAHRLATIPDKNSLANLLASGEQVSAASLSLLLNSLGCRARDLNIWQAGIRLSNDNGEITSFNVDYISAMLADGWVCIIPGFIGLDGDNNIITLPRGGSDYTAIMVAGLLGAISCDIYTDVAGIYNVDPNVYGDARVLSHISPLQLENISKFGGEVMQYQAACAVRRFGVKIRVTLASAPELPGTIISHACGLLVAPVLCIQRDLVMVVSSEIDDELLKNLNENGLILYHISKIGVIVTKNYLLSELFYVLCRTINRDLLQVKYGCYSYTIIGENQINIDNFANEINFLGEGDGFVSYLVRGDGFACCMLINHLAADYLQRLCRKIL